MAVGAVFLTGGIVHAAQFVVADATYTHSAQTTTDSHYRVVPAAGTPANWTSPVDYANGSAHVRVEVRTKPNTTTETCFQVCFEATQNYGCTDISKPYTTIGTYEWDTPFSRFYKPGPVPWEKGILKVALLLKDTKNVKPAPENVGAATSALYMPTDLRVTVTIVSSGSTFQPPAGTTPADAGSPDANRATDANPNVTDATANPDTNFDARSTPPPEAEDAVSMPDTAPPGPDTASPGPDTAPPAPTEDAGSVDPPPTSVGQGGNTGMTPAASVSQDAASVSSPPSSSGQGGNPVGQPSGAASVSGGSGCSVVSRDVPANGAGLICAFALAARLLRRATRPSNIVR